ncbi:MAG: GGDEF domain-containing protein, partial [Halopseudomonas sp.]
GFSINEAISEYRALRVNVLRLWIKQIDPATAPDCLDDILRFNEAIDQSLTEALASYTTEKDMDTRLLKTILSASTDQTFVLNPEGRFVYVNAATTDLFDRPQQHVIGKTCFDLGFDFAASLQRNLMQVISSGESYRGEFSYTLGAGQHFEYILSPVLVQEAGYPEVVEAVVGIARDITLRKAAEDQSWHQANFDILTNLPNRRLFIDRLQQDLRHAERAGLSMAVMFIDLDGFKEVNDSMGHEAGDTLLRLVAQRMKECVRESDTVARMGGDEFTVALNEVSAAEQALHVAGKITDALCRPFTVHDMLVQISASVGVARYPADAKTADELVNLADRAMYAAKRAGRNQVILAGHGAALASLAEQR